MHNLTKTFYFFPLFVAVKSEGQVTVTFNSSKETRQFAKLSDTLNIELIPSTKSKTAKYRFHNISITYEGHSKIKGDSKLIHTNRLVSDTTLSRNLIIKVPLRNYVNSIANYGMKVFINIESVDILTNGKSQMLNIPKSELHREFTCTNN